MNMMLRSKKPAFSLVELVIVVVIIGVIAAIAVPRISRGAKGAGDSALRGSLAGLRNAIDMFAAEHGGTFPGYVNATTCDETLLTNQLTQKSDFSGTVGTGAGFDFGPYLRRAFPPAPVGPQAGKATGVLISTTSPPAAEALPTAGKGWVYNCITGELVVNTQTTDANGDRYDQKY